MLPFGFLVCGLAWRCGCRSTFCLGEYSASMYYNKKLDLGEVSGNLNTSFQFPVGNNMGFTNCL